MTKRSHCGVTGEFVHNNRTLTDCAGLQLGLHSVIVSGKLLVDVGLHHVVLRETQTELILSLNK